MSIDVNLPAVSVEQTQPMESGFKHIVKTEPNLLQTPKPQPQTSWQDLSAAALNWLKSIPRIWLIIGGGSKTFIIYTIHRHDHSYH